MCMVATLFFQELIRIELVDLLADEIAHLVSDGDGCHFARNHTLYV